MKAEDVSRTITTPLGSPAYPPGSYHFTNREYLNITYRTDPDALRAVVPEPLEIDNPLVRFEVMAMPDTTGLGSYLESGQAIQVRHKEEVGEYLHAMYVSSVPAISSGRELSAYPKKGGTPKLFVDSETLIGTLDYGCMRIANATMGYKSALLDPEAAREELCRPTYMLKIVHGYDGKPRICDLIRTQIKDIKVKGAWTGPGRLQLFQHVSAPLADLPVLEIIKVTHILTDLSLTGATVAHDYLAS